MLTIVDLNAEAEKLTTLHGVTPQATPARRAGGIARLGTYRGGLLLLGTGTSPSPGQWGHWEIHPEDELIYMLDGTKTLEIVCDDGPPKSFELRAGTIAVVPQGAWHRFHALGYALAWSAVIPGPHCELDVPDPRPHVSEESRFANRSPSIIDLPRELATLTMVGRTPEATAADRNGSVAELAPYRDGLLLAVKASGKDYWQRHLVGEEIIHVLDGTASLELVGDDGPPKSFPLRAGTMGVIPQGAWRRLVSPEGFTHFAVTPRGGETIERDVDDPRKVERSPA
jgi:quercetin dioxygenase-like cupin family protein